MALPTFCYPHDTLRDEYNNLRQVIPSLRIQRNVSKIEVVSEAARYIDHLHKSLIEKFATVGIPANLKGLLRTDDPHSLDTDDIKNLVTRLAHSTRAEISTNQQQQQPQQQRQQQRHRHRHSMAPMRSYHANRRAHRSSLSSSSSSSSSSASSFCSSPVTSSLSHLRTPVAPYTTQSSAQGRTTNANDSVDIKQDIKQQVRRVARNSQQSIDCARHLSSSSTSSSSSSSSSSSPSSPRIPLASQHRHSSQVNADSAIIRGSHHLNNDSI